MMGLGSVRRTVLVTGVGGFRFEPKTPLEFGLRKTCEDFPGRLTARAVAS
jgi:hypothetical protein